MIVKEKKKRKTVRKNIIQIFIVFLGGCHTHRLSSTDSLALGLDSFGKPNQKRKKEWAREKRNHLTFHLTVCWIDTALAGKRKRRRRKGIKKNSPGRSCCCNYSASVESRAGRITTVKVRLPGSPGEESQMSPFSTTGCQAARQTAAVTGRFEHAFLIVV